MPESFAASEDLGFVALSLPTGGSIWLAAASIYALETHPEEEFTTVKTVGEAIGVVEEPAVVFGRIEALQTATEERNEAKGIKKFVDWVEDNHIKVAIEADEPIGLVESDGRAKALRKIGYPIIGEFAATGVVDLEAESKADWQYEISNGDTTLGFEEWLKHRSDVQFDESIDAEFGSDLSDSLNEARRRADEQNRPDSPMIGGF